MNPSPPELRRCVQCGSAWCGANVCRFSGLTTEEFRDWQNAEGPERVPEADEDWRDDYRSRYREIAK